MVVARHGVVRRGNQPRFRPFAKKGKSEETAASKTQGFKRCKLGIPNIIPGRLRDGVDEIEIIPGVALVKIEKAGPIRLAQRTARGIRVG